MTENPYQPPSNAPDPGGEPLTTADGKLVIRYDLSLDDVVAFHRYFFANSSTVRNQKYFVVGMVGIIILAANVAIITEFPLIVRVVGALLLTAIFGVFFHYLQRSSLERQAKRMVLSGGTEGVLGAHELELDESRIVERTDVNEMRQALAAIDKIEETDDHAFVFISALQAHIVPKRRLTAGDAEHFVSQLRRRVDEAKAAGGAPS